MDTFQLLMDGFATVLHPTNLLFAVSGGDTPHAVRTLAVLMVMTFSFAAFKPMKGE